MLRFFKSDDSSSVRKNVEGCQGRLCLLLDFLLLAERCSSKCIDLAMCVLGGFAKGLIFGAAMHFRLYRHSRALCLDIFGLLGLIGQTK